MGRFGWVAHHSKQGSDKSQYLPHEWFSKSTAEPSRQALDQLRKDLEVGGEISPTTSPRSRSRSGTVSSTLSFYPKSPSDKSSDEQTRPPSRQSVLHEAGRAENAARNFFSIGTRLIRRQGSKLTLSPAQVENGLVASGILDSDDASVSKRGSSSKSSSHRLLPAGSPKSSDIKANISGPYDFQHVSHTDQGHFQSLNKVSKLDLVQEFTAVQEGQIPVQEVRGIAVSDLPPPAEASAASGAPSPSSPSSTMPDLPSTPPRPAPPLKDGLSPPPKAPDVRLSRSMENFSRPTRSPIAVGFEGLTVPENTVLRINPSPVSVLETVPQSPSGWAEETVDVLANVTASRRQSVAAFQVSDKPLPHPPSIVHAVSTNDESALPLRNAPLPELPQIPTAALESTAPALRDQAFAQTLQMPHRVSLRHAQSFPTTKLLRRRSQSSGDIPFASSFAAPTPYTMNTSKPKRISIGLKKIDIEDWEDAIDYAWDHDLDLAGIGVPEFDLPTINTQTPPSRPESLLVVHQPRPDPVTQPSTPLMMMQSHAPDKPLPTPAPSKRLSSLHHPSNKVALQGLGIASDVQQSKRIEHTTNFDRPRKHESFPMSPSAPTIPAIRREPGSPISKSSSQESIILSIASSILGTHRSSNSSTSLGDLSTLTSIEDENEAEALQARAQFSSDHKHSPLGITTARPSDDSNRSGHTSDGSQETVKTDIAPAAPTYAPPPPPVDQTRVSPQRHRRSTSISRASVPNRTSSIAAPTMMKAPAARSRSSTLTNRPRYNPSRASYSLFPSAQPVPATNTATLSP